MVGEVLGVLPQRVAGSLQPLRELASGSWRRVGWRTPAAAFGLVLGEFAGVVPRLAADLVERVGCPFDDVERICDADRVRAPGGHDGVDEVGSIGADMGDL